MPKRVREDGFIEYSGFFWKLALPQAILASGAAIVAGLCWWSVATRGGGWLSVAGGLVAGLLLWTVFEYILHRWMLHGTEVPFLREVMWKKLHAEHHGYRSMKDPDHHGVHLFLVIPVIGTVTAAVALLSASPWALSILAGWFAGYNLYEGLHWLFHAGTPGRGLLRVPYLHTLYLAHTTHHLDRIETNYGFVTLFWDKRFGTYRPYTGRQGAAA